MSARKTHQEAKAQAPNVVPAAARSRKRARGARVRLTHFEVRRGDALRLRIAIADDAFAEVGDELGALIKRIAPSTKVAVVQPVPRPEPEPEPDLIVSRSHAEHDVAYHAQVRDHLAELFRSLCDTGLADALDIAREERDRRAEGGN